MTGDFKGIGIVITDRQFIENTDERVGALGCRGNEADRLDMTLQRAANRLTKSGKYPVLAGWPFIPSSW